MVLPNPSRATRCSESWTRCSPTARLTRKRPAHNAECSPRLLHRFAERGLTANRRLRNQTAPAYATPVQLRGGGQERGEGMIPRIYYHSYRINAALTLLRSPRPRRDPGVAACTGCHRSIAVWMDHSKTDLSRSPRAHPVRCRQLTVQRAVRSVTPEVAGSSAVAPVPFQGVTDAMQATRQNVLVMRPRESRHSRSSSGRRGFGRIRGDLPRTSR